MSERTLADLAREYEETAKTLELQIERIDEQLKKHPFSAKNYELERKRAILEDMHLVVKLNATTLKTYYDK